MARESAAADGLREDEVAFEAGGAALKGSLALPKTVDGLVVFAHGSGSSRFSPRNRAVAQQLQSAGFATLLFDLLTEPEEREDERTAELRFDIGFLSARLGHVIAWARRESRLSGLPTGLFGASTGAAAALVAAATHPDRIKAVVSRGGRPDLANEHLQRVRAPTLLIVGGADDIVIRLNRSAFDRLGGPRRLEVIPGATHLFEEPGALDEVARLAGAWFSEHLR